MAYNELIKSFENMRFYIRDFYVFGFKKRSEYDTKSARSYDNERRRLESWLGEYMAFRYNSNGKRVFLSVDTRQISRNPLYEAFRAKSFTDLDILLHFVILDILSDGKEKTVQEILATMVALYQTDNTSAEVPDEQTIRNKLREYQTMGILNGRKQGREVLYRLELNHVDFNALGDMLAFFTVVSPVGVIGTRLLQENDSPFRFKHQYLFSALDSEIIEQLLICMENKRQARLTIFSKNKKEETVHLVFPLRFYISTQSGRQYLLAWHYEQDRFMFFRLDSIHKLSEGQAEQDANIYEEKYHIFSKHVWGVSNRCKREKMNLTHIEMEITVADEEQFVIRRLFREKRCGFVTQTGPTTWLYSADVYDATEMLPWIRSYIGRIIRLECDNPSVQATFAEDLKQTLALYEGGCVDDLS